MSQPRKLPSVIIISVCLVALIACTSVIGLILKSLLIPPNQKSDFLPIAASPGNEVTENPEIERKPDYYNILLLGTDSIGMNTDTIMLVSIDGTKKKISILQLPRDTYIEYENTGCKLNSVFKKKLEQSGSAKESVEGLARLLEKSLCIPIDYCAVIDLAVLRETVDAIGGVTVDIPADMYYVDNKQGLKIDLKAGVSTLNGDQAEQFIRYRSGYLQADIGRMDAQKLFLSALIRKVKTEFTLSQITAVVRTAIKNINTTIPVSDAIYLASKIYESIGESDITMKTLQGGAYKNGMYYIMYRSAAYETVNTYFNAYSTDIPEDAFDSELIFTDNDDSVIKELYYAKDAASDGKTAEDINDNGIYIPMLK